MTTYLAVAFGYWGKGATEEEALKQVRKSGAKKNEKTVIYRNDHGDKDGPTVDRYGTIGSYGELVEVAYYVNGKRKEIA